MSLRYAILGFLSLRPLSGYELKKAFDNSVRHFWAADQAQIYRALAALTDDGLTTVERVPSENLPDRKVHHLTPAGADALHGWLVAPTERPQRREPFLVKLFFSGSLSQSERRRLISAECEALDAELAMLRVVVGPMRAASALPQPGIDYAGPVATLANGARLGRAYRVWLQELLEMNESGRLAPDTFWNALTSDLQPSSEPPAPRTRATSANGTTAPRRTRSRQK